MQSIKIKRRRNEPFLLSQACQEDEWVSIERMKQLIDGWNLGIGVIISKRIGRPVRIWKRRITVLGKNGDEP